jgi:hypothetical protein
MALPAWTFLLVGLIVTSVSAYVGQKLVLFFYIGLLFVVWGMFKYAVAYLTKQPTTTEERKVEKTLRTPVIACPYCATSVYATARYCHLCGGRLR